MVHSDHAGPTDERPTPIPPRHRVPLHLARRFHQVCLGAAAEVFEPEGITPGEYGMLAAIQDSSGPDQRRLAATLGIDPVNAGQMIDRLEAADLVQRRIDPGDRRARLLSMTPKGEALRQRLRPAALEVQDRILAPLSDIERATLLELLTRVVEGNKNYARPGNGRRRPLRKGSERNDTDKRRAAHRADA